MLEGGISDIVEESGKSLLLVMGEAPDDKSNTDAVSEDGIRMFKTIEAAIFDAVDHADAAEALHFWGSDIAQEPGGEFWRKHAEVFAMGGAEVVETTFAAADDVDGFFATARANEELWTGGWGWFGRVSAIGR